MRRVKGPVTVRGHRCLGGDGMSQDMQRTPTTGHGPATGAPMVPAQGHPGPVRAPYGVPAPRQAPTGPQPMVPAAHAAPMRPYAPYGWDPAADVDDPRPAGNAAATSSVILGLLALLVSLRPLAFGSMAMAWDTYLALGLAVVALVVGGVAMRTPVRRPVAVVGMVVSVVALLVVAILPTL